MDQKSLLASSSSRVESSWSWVWKFYSSDFPWRISCSSPRFGRSRVKVDILRRCSPHRFWLFHLRRWLWIFHFFAALTLPLHGAFWRGVHMRPSPPFLHNVCDHDVSFPDSPRVTYITEKYTWQDFCSKLMQSRLIFRRNKRWYSTIAPNGITGLLNGIPNRLSYGAGPTDKISWMFSR